MTLAADTLDPKSTPAAWGEYLRLRGELYAKVQDIVYNDGYSVPLNFVPSVNAYHNYVHGWRTVANGWWWLKDIWIDK